MKELGIVIPAYNAHDTIRKLLHSIGCFSFLDKVEVVIVDDASEEPYDYLLDDFKDLDLNLIRLEENVGPGFARQAGIDYFIEKDIPYLMFADADDYFFDFFFWDEVPTEKKEENHIFLFQFYCEEGNHYMDDIDIWMFAKVYKTCFIKDNNIRFINSYCNEDVVFNFAYYGYITNVYKTEKPIYYWYNRPSSLSRQEDYLYRSIRDVSLEISKIFNIHKDSFLSDRIPHMILSRMSRLFGDVNEALLYYPDLFSNEEKHSDCLRGIRTFYKECYKPYEHLFTREEVIANFMELYENPTQKIFQTIDYFSFINKLKETS